MPGFRVVKATGQRALRTGELFEGSAPTPERRAVHRGATEPAFAEAAPSAAGLRAALAAL